VKGIIFNLVEEVVAAEMGDDVWDSLLKAAGLDGVYTSLGSYPDEELFRLVAAASSAMGQPPDQVVRHLGEGALPLLAERYPFFFEPYTSTEPFLRTLNAVIHSEVRKLYPGAEVPDFDFESEGSGVLVIGYESPRRLCSLAEGFIVATARHYGEQVDISQSECMKTGSDKCLIRCSFHRPPDAPAGA
jgi:hypothetical protein